MDKLTAMFLARLIINDKVEMEKITEKMNLFTDLIFKMNSSLGKQMDLVGEQMEISDPLQNPSAISDLILLGYMGNYFRYTTSYINGFPGIDHFILLHLSMKQILIDENLAIDVTDYRDFESIVQSFKEQKE